MFFVRNVFSSHTWRIVILNLTGLVALTIGIFHFSQFTDGLILGRLQSLWAQGEIIANTIAAAVSDSAGSNYVPDRRSDEAMVQFSIDPERVALLLRHSTSMRTIRARLYDRDGSLIIDSRDIYFAGDSAQSAFPQQTDWGLGMLQNLLNATQAWFNWGDLPRYHELGSNAGKDYPEVANVLAGARYSSTVRVDERGELIMSAALPVQRGRELRGALLLTTSGADINELIEKQQLTIIKLFLIVTVVMLVLSLMLGSSIARHR